MWGYLSKILRGAAGLWAMPLSRELSGALEPGKVLGEAGLARGRKEMPAQRGLCSSSCWAAVSCSSACKFVHVLEAS